MSQMNLSGDTVTDNSQQIAVLNAMAASGNSDAGFMAQGLAMRNLALMGANSD